MFDCAHTLMTKVIEYYYHKGPRTCWQTWYPKADGYWDGDALVWGQGSGLSAFVAMREASLGTGQERHYESLDNDMFSGIQAFWIADRGRTAYSVYPAAGNERFYDDNVWIGLDMAEVQDIVDAIEKDADTMCSAERNCFKRNSILWKSGMISPSCSGTSASMAWNSP